MGRVALGRKRWGQGLRGRWSTFVVFALLLLAVSAPVALAQTQPIPSGSTVSVANTDGERLNLRAGPSTSETVVTQLEAGARLTVTGAAQSAGGVRWLPVRTASGQNGFVSAEFVQVVSTPAPTLTRTPDPVAAPASDQPQGSTDPPATATPVPGKPVDIEAKLKYPEVQGPEQEITVWVTRDGVPVPGVLVTVQTVNGDDEERFEELDPTNEEGRARKSFSIRHEKGTVELIVRAVAPDGGLGQTTVSYFRR